MAKARRQFEGELICYLIAWIPQAVFASKPIDPDRINPWKEAAPRMAAELKASVIKRETA